MIKCVLVVTKKKTLAVIALYFYPLFQASWSKS